MVQKYIVFKIYTQGIYILKILLKLRKFQLPYATFQQDTLGRKVYLVAKKIHFPFESNIDISAGC